MLNRGVDSGKIVKLTQNSQAIRQLDGGEE
jgi:hypothetical protein